MAELPTKPGGGEERLTFCKSSLAAAAMELGLALTNLRAQWETTNIKKVAPKNLPGPNDA